MVKFLPKNPPHTLWPITQIIFSWFTGFLIIYTEKIAMHKPIHPLALFRLSVLGPLASRDRLERGELKKIIADISSKTYHIPESKRTHLSPYHYP